MTNPFDQRGIDLKALREHGFSNLPADQQARLVGNGELDETPRLPVRRINDLVGLESDLGSAKYRGITFRIVKVNPKTYLLAPLNGGIKVRAAKELVTDSPETATVRPAGPNDFPASIEDVPLPEPVTHLPAGTLVRLTGVRQEKGWLRNGTLAVVLIDKGDRINCAPLGGHPDDRYARLPRRMVTVVDPQSVLRHEGDQTA